MIPSLKPPRFIMTSTHHPLKYRLYQCGIVTSRFRDDKEEKR
jgi:hypothetical protein